MYDKNNNIIFDQNTDSFGKIPPHDVIIGTYRKEFGQTLQSLNPFTLIISKEGYETYTSTFDLTEKYRSIITLTPPEYMYIDRVTEVEKLKTIISNENLISIINQDIITAKIIEGN